MQNIVGNTPLAVILSGKCKNYEISTNFLHMFVNACFVGEQYPYGQKLTDQNWRENYTRLQSTKTASAAQWRSFLLSGEISQKIGT